MAQLAQQMWRRILISSNLKFKVQISKSLPIRQAGKCQVNVTLNQVLNSIQDLTISGSNEPDAETSSA
jgi:hypothetical protein